MFTFPTIKIKNKVNRVKREINLVKAANQLNVQAHQALLSILIPIFNNIRIDYLKFHLKIPKAFCLTPEEVVFPARKNK
jgi:hypothetical protein